MSGQAPPLFAHERIVRFQDVDAASTIFYPRVLEYFSDAYVAMLLHAGVDLPAQLATGSWVAPIVHAEADYRWPLRFGDAVSVEIIAVRAGRTSFEVDYRIRAGERIAASGRTVHVVVDRGTFAPCPLPEALRTRLEKLGATSKP